MAPRVCDGMVGGGTLFEGMRFHVHQRVPLRSTVVQQIEANGGEIQPLEKGSDLVIADHARKDAPPGSISWKFISQSIKTGVLQDMGDYPASKIPRRTKDTAAAGVPTVASPSSSTQFPSRRTGRTPFTHEDDSVLMEFCTRKERLGIQTKGNIIFNELAELNPRHTSQSWRDRWVKHLHDRPRPTLNEEEEKPSPKRPAPKSKTSKPISMRPRLETPHKSSTMKRTMQPPRAEPPKSDAKPSAKKPTEKLPQAGPSNAKMKPSSTNPVESPPTKSKSSIEDRPYLETSLRKNDFTTEETQMLFQYHDSIMNIDEDKVIDAWIAFSVANPTHTPQEWRNHFNWEVKGKNMPSKQPNRESPRNSPSLSPQSYQSKDKGKGKAKEGNTTPEVPSLEIKDSQGSSNNTMKSPENTTAPANPDLSNEETFITNFNSMAEILLPARYAAGINFSPEICEIPVSLYEIWRVVHEVFGGLTNLDEETRWPELAAKLGFVEEALEVAGKDLKKHCDDLLVEFAEALESFNEVTESQANEMLGDQLQQTAMEAALRSRSSSIEELTWDKGDDDNDNNPNALQSSPPVTLSVKRLRPNTTTPARKRQKINQGNAKDMEIPSTPEDIINSNKRKSPPKSSPLKQVSAQADDFSEDELSMFIPEEKPPSRPKAPPKPQISDPYTQDFHFDSLPKEDEPPEEADEEQHVEVSPTPSRKRRVATPNSNGNRNNQSSLSTANATRNSMPSQTTTSTQSQTVSQNDQSIEEFYEYCMSLGYDKADVGTAMLSTSMTPGPAATFAMQSLRDGNGIPDAERGVWTEKDDTWLHTFMRNKERNKPKYAKLLRKHGVDSIKKRWRFLRDLEEN